MKLYKINFIFYYKNIIFSQQWLLDKQDLIRERQHDLGILTEEEYQKIFIFFANCKFFCINKIKVLYVLISLVVWYFNYIFFSNSNIR